MELVVTLHKSTNIDRLKGFNVSGVIFGSLFSYGYDYSLEDMVELNNRCIHLGLQRYVIINSLISESELDKLDAYLDLVKELNVDGIYFSDLAVMCKAYEKEMNNLLIYDPCNLNTNYKDINFFSEFNIECVLARELTLDEIMETCRKFPESIDMQIFGHLRMSASKRNFISNYFHNFKIDYNPKGKETYSIMEKSRTYKLPIMEDEMGTCVYTDYVFAMTTGLIELSKYLHRAIIDDLFIEEDLVVDYLKILNKINESNLDLMKESLSEKYPNYKLSDGYMYQKTTDVKVKDE